MSDSATPWTVAHMAPPSMEFSRQEYWSGLPFSSPHYNFFVLESSLDDLLIYLFVSKSYLGFSGGSDSKESGYNARDPGPIPGLRRSTGKGNGNPFQSSFLENPMDRGARRARVHGVAKNRTGLSD